MIETIQSKALKRYWTKGDPALINPQWRKKVELILNTLEQAVRPEAVDLPGLGFHALKGDRRGEYAVAVSGNWRITFGWDGTNAVDVDLEDYHGD